MPIEEAERAFETELEVYRTEVEVGLQYLYVHIGLHAVLGRDPEALRRVNETPLLWKTIDGALHGSAFIALGRIFDQESEHNVDRLLRLARHNLGLFSKDRLAARKRRHSDTADIWLAEYLETVHEATVEDFREAKRQVSAHRRIFDNIYRPIRNLIFAHKALIDASEIKALYDKTRIDELAGLFAFLHRVYDVLFQLYHNGEPPEWTYTVVDAAELLVADLPEEQPRSLPVRIVLETRDLIRSLMPDEPNHDDRALAAEAPVSSSR